MGFAFLATPVNQIVSLPACVTLIRQRHECVLNASGFVPETRRLEENLISLRLTEAFLEKDGLNRQMPGHPLQIAVIGPTQSGKSSLVNLLLGEDRAQVSPLAGYTIHPQGFPVNTSEPSWDTSAAPSTICLKGVMASSPWIYPLPVPVPPPSFGILRISTRWMRRNTALLYYGRQHWPM